MATPRRPDARHHTTPGNRFRLSARVLGATGLVAVAAGAVLASTDLPPPAAWTPDLLQPLAQGEGGVYAQVAVLALAGGLLAVALWLLTELVGGLFLVTGRKTAVGTNAAVQVALAAALLGIVNVYSFSHYKRFDLTRDAQFTLPADQADQLGQLRTDAPTTVVVLQLHKTAGTLSDKPDAYDYAAERKVVEKVTDLVGQLREFGPRFNVVVLDVEDEKYERTLRDLTRTRPGLAPVIQAAPENSIFFYADGKVRRVPRAEADRLAAGGTAAVAPDPADAAQSLVYPGAVTRMSFAEFYQLDKTASREATAAEREEVAAVAGGPAFAPGVRGRGNLVLIPQGRAAFVNKVLALEDRKPRVGLAVIHPYLTSREVFDDYTAAGLRQSLEANGFDVTDIILKRGWGRRGEPAPAAYTYEENELDRVEARYNLYSLLRYDRDLVVKELAKVLDTVVNKAPLPELDRMFRRQLGRPVATEADRADIRERFQDTIKFRTDELAEFDKALAEVTPRYRDLLKDERAAENRRVTDVKDKLRQYVADCDVLIVPRLTTLDLTRSTAGGIIPPGLFNLSADQAAVVREFVAAGKPVLFALGPTNLDGPFPADNSGPDDVEKLLPRLGVELGRQTVLSFKEEEAMAERQNETLGVAVDVPPVDFDPPAAADGKTPNPVGGAFRVTARAVDRKLDVKRSGFRPVYVAPGFADSLPFAAEVMFAGRDTWNEAKPLSDDQYVPKFEPAKPDDPKKGTRDEERRGPFPVGVAVEVPVPVEWLTKAELPAGAVPAAAVGGVAAADTSAPPGFADEQKLAAVLPTFDGGLSALGLTLAARQLDRPTVRVAVYGHGGLFTGKKLDPAHETLLLHTLNWQLRRDDRLPKDAADDAKWRFPRVELSDRGYAAWRWGTLLGLPLVCGYLGLVVLMARKLR